MGIEASSASGRACIKSEDSRQPEQRDGGAGRGWRRILSLILITVSIASCDGGVLTEEPATLRFGYDYWPGYYPALIAAEKGYFAEEGLIVKITKRDDTDALMADFGAGEYDAIGASLGDIVDLTLVHPDVRIILVTDISEGGDAVLARPGIEKVEDLRGRAFGVNLGSFAELFVLTVLKSHGLSSADIRLVDTDAAAVPAKLKSGEVDAGHTWEPFVTQARAEGARVLFTSAATPGLIQDVVAVRGEVLRERAKALSAFVKGWFKAVDYWKAHPDLGNTLAARVLKVGPNTISLEGIHLTTLQDNIQLFKAGETTRSTYYTARLYVDFFLGSGGLTRKPDVEHILEPRFLN
ncbi:MAG: ABC transporter substrate-binding protein [Gammaproteobacteria bacterium]